MVLTASNFLPWFVDLCLEPNPETRGLDLQARIMLVPGDVIVVGTNTFRFSFGTPY